MTNVDELQVGKNLVSFQSEGETLSALLYIPQEVESNLPLPAMVIARPGTGVKEQTAQVYAEALSQRGFITLAFDARGFGDSEGAHLQVENPYSVVEDIKNSVSYLSTLSLVDTQRLFNVGICMGAGYAYYATALDARVKAVGMISPYLNAAEQNIAAFGTVANLREYYLSGTSKARQDFFENGVDTYFSPVPESDSNEVLPIANGMRGYYLPGHPGAESANWQNKLNLYGAEAILTFSAFNVIPLMDNIPMFMALGSEAYTVDNSKDFYEKASEPKALFMLEGQGHFDIYWRKENVEPVANALATFLKAN
ncbi:alpha/beta hydrolase [Enterovibrio calviensis]|uniref:alpha/beta hydrolase n=1 Tax=Enterovibrio calviensis TaxID=91359 RepID=UPI000488A926|nr:alpha/beta hydrolase [Enterovibrio calviensis]